MCIVKTGGPSWSVELGRRDGTVSSASDVSTLPAPTDSVDIQRQKFSDKGLSDHDLVTLVGTYLIFSLKIKVTKEFSIFLRSILSTIHNHSTNFRCSYHRDDGMSLRQV